MSTAIESLTSVSVRSDFFKNNVTFEFFPATHKNRVALTYGKNGSGKSTIAQGFREHLISANPRTVDLSLLAGEDQIVNTHGGQVGKFLIFDETYVKNNISIKEDGLEAIVLFGAQVDLDKQIGDLSAEIATLKVQEGQQDKESQKYNTASDVVSPQHWINTIMQILRQSGGWAETSGITISGNRRASSVTESEVTRIGNLSPMHDEVTTRAEFNRQLAIFQSTSSHSQTLNNIIKEISPRSDLETTATTLLATLIQKPTLTQREEELLGLFERSGINNSKTLLSDQTKSICSSCLQPITEEYRVQILSQIENILNREVEEFCKEVQNHSISEITEDYLQYSNLNPTSYTNVQICLTALNDAIKAYNGQLMEKINNPFEVLIYDTSIKILDAYDSFNTALTQLEAERISFNNAILGRRELQQKLIALNDDIAYYAIRSNYTSFLNQKVAKQQVDDKLTTIRSTLRAKEQEKLELDSQRRNFQIAADEINRSLSYIFFSNGRLELEPGVDQVYHLKSYGNPVDPQKISCGERNALALSYFFTEIAKDMDASAIYSNEVFLVIDDPVSSFDLENRIGILSFLRWRLGQVLGGCATTKVLLLTHDISVMFDMEKAFQEISEYCKNHSKDATFRLFQLENKHLVEFSYRKHNEYTRLISSVFKYAKGDSSENGFFIGNAMRRVLEAFATFVYKKGIDKISSDEIVLSQIANEEKRDYFRNLMYRLVLNNESHYEEQIRGLQNMNFFSLLSEEEKQRTAKDILCFLYLLNDTHVLAHLPNAKPEIESWIAKIGRQSAIAATN